MVRLGFPKQIPGISNVAVGNSSRNASGAQAITGLGFVPKVIIIFAFGTGGTQKVWSNGFDDATTHRCVYSRGDVVDLENSTANSIVVMISATAYIFGYVSSMDADGFTITWTLVGTATANFHYLAMK